MLFRSNRGWGFDEFTSITGFDLEREWSADMDQLVRDGLALRTATRFQLTPAGLRFADLAAEKFLRS